MQINDWNKKGQISFQDYCFIKGDEYALVQIREPDRPAVLGEGATQEGVAAEVELDGYNVTLIITQDPARSLDLDNELLKLKFFVVLTRLRDFHPKRTLEKKFGDFRSGSTSHQSHAGGQCMQLAIQWAVHQMLV